VADRKSGGQGLGKAFWLAMAVGLVLLGGVLWWTNQQAGVQQARFARLGGPFELIDQDGHKFTQEDLKGKYTLLYFGYTYCPDVCPTELTILAEALDKLGELRKQVRVVLVTVDPERDTPEVLKDYISNFAPEFIGLTGTPEQIRKMAKQWRAFYRKVPGEGPDDYTMDHSAITYLLDRNGQYIHHFAYGTPPDQVASVIYRAMTGKAREKDGKGAS